LRIDDTFTPVSTPSYRVRPRTPADFAAASIIGGDGVSGRQRVPARGHDQRPDGVWMIFDSRLRRLLPYVRCELDLAWFPLGRIER
jgi:hypothetical protein